jgi:hypothetical protein
MSPAEEVAIQKKVQNIRNNVAQTSQPTQSSSSMGMDAFDRYMQIQDKYLGTKSAAVKEKIDAAMSDYKASGNEVSSALEKMINETKSDVEKPSIGEVLGKLAGAFGKPAPNFASSLANAGQASGDVLEKMRLDNSAAKKIARELLLKKLEFGHGDKKDLFNMILNSERKDEENLRANFSNAASLRDQDVRHDLTRQQLAQQAQHARATEANAAATLAESKRQHNLANAIALKKLTMQGLANPKTFELNKEDHKLLGNYDRLNSAIKSFEDLEGVMAKGGQVYTGSGPDVLANWATRTFGIPSDTKVNTIHATDAAVRAMLNEVSVLAPVTQPDVKLLLDRMTPEKFNTSKEYYEYLRSDIIPGLTRIKSKLEPQVGATQAKAGMYKQILDIKKQLNPSILDALQQ